MPKRRTGETWKPSTSHPWNVRARQNAQQRKRRGLDTTADTLAEQREAEELEERLDLVNLPSWLK